MAAVILLTPHDAMRLANAVTYSSGTRPRRPSGHCDGHGGQWRAFHVRCVVAAAWGAPALSRVVVGRDIAAARHHGRRDDHRHHDDHGLAARPPRGRRPDALVVDVPVAPRKHSGFGTSALRQKAGVMLRCRRRRKCANKRPTAAQQKPIAKPLSRVATQRTALRDLAHNTLLRLD